MFNPPRSSRLACQIQNRKERSIKECVSHGFLLGSSLHHRSCNRFHVPSSTTPLMNSEFVDLSSTDEHHYLCAASPPVVSSRTSSGGR
ncbi:unnamed protein product [Musa acuminata subsp. malaccensis]|uniref:(wild Malaysian banana) hypothetical protein n=1 Tax=Musa acuminata subsp. malaccensis TaxID=214687 RepID=A0A804J2K0_MUSAM|nr:unnamed protein product [Musa acuminata subsp. malaccensis]